jgi:hypothetical protein
MIALMKLTTTDAGDDVRVPIAIEPDLIASVESHPDNADLCIVILANGRHVIDSPYKYVTGIIRTFYENN